MCYTNYWPGYILMSLSRFQVTVPVSHTLLSSRFREGQQTSATQLSWDNALVSGQEISATQTQWRQCFSIRSGGRPLQDGRGGDSALVSGISTTQTRLRQCFGIGTGDLCNTVPVETVLWYQVRRETSATQSQWRQCFSIGSGDLRNTVAVETVLWYWVKRTFYNTNLTLTDAIYLNTNTLVSEMKITIFYRHNVDMVLDTC